MENKFYGEFDFERLKQSSRTNDYRTVFQIDRDRIIHSSEFRRLQGKTQVFLPGESDYYRTRLTHSIEVAQIGRSICNYLVRKENSPFSDNYFIDPDLVESACLAHDLGHPPFGHAGERTLNSLMSGYGGFEGNAQTLRLLTEILYRSENDRRGMNPSRAFIDSILKYKNTYSELGRPVNHFIFDYQKEYVDFVFGGKTADIENIDLNKFRSIECQIMDWADDTAYAINDIVDSISGGFITYNGISRWIEQNGNSLDDEELLIVNRLKEWITKGNYKPKLGSIIGDFILACSVTERETFRKEVTNRYRYVLSVDEKIKKQAELYKKIAVDLVFTSPPLHQVEFKADEMITRMFKVFTDNYIVNKKETKLLPVFTHNLIVGENDYTQKARLICDYISGMTDSFAMRVYKRLFDPDYSSLSDFD